MIDEITASPEQFLIEPQDFGAPNKLIVWKLLRGDVYEHYLSHAAIIQKWLNKK